MRIANVEYFFSNRGNVGRRFVVSLIVLFGTFGGAAVAQELLTSDPPHCDAACQDRVDEGLRNIFGPEGVPKYDPKEGLDEIFRDAKLPPDVVATRVPR